MVVKKTIAALPDRSSFSLLDIVCFPSFVEQNFPLPEERSSDLGLVVPN